MVKKNKRIGLPYCFTELQITTKLKKKKRLQRLNTNTFILTQLKISYTWTSCTLLPLSRTSFGLFGNRADPDDEAK